MILRIANRRIETLSELRYGLRRAGVNRRVLVGIRRGEKLIDLHVTTRQKKP